MMAGTATETVKVKVCDGYAVYDGKTQQSGGKQIEVPADLAEQWTAAGWVEPVAKTSTPKRPGRR